jgi:hypothetical protein
MALTTGDKSVDPFGSDPYLMRLYVYVYDNRAEKPFLSADPDCKKNSAPYAVCFPELTPDSVPDTGLIKNCFYLFEVLR